VGGEKVLMGKGFEGLPIGIMKESKGGGVGMVDNLSDICCEVLKITCRYAATNFI
jgi:hypothetical protein